MEKKEIYFESDVFKEVSKVTGTSLNLIGPAFKSFLGTFKYKIESSSDLIYDLPNLGELMITKGEALKQMNKYDKQRTREKNPIEKERLANIVKNYRLRVKKIKVEVEKIKFNNKYSSREVRNKALARKFGMTTPDNTKRRSLFLGETLFETTRRQNEFAYKHYNDKNLPVTL